MVIRGLIKLSVKPFNCDAITLCVFKKMVHHTKRESYFKINEMLL